MKKWTLIALAAAVIVGCTTTKSVTEEVEEQKTETVEIPSDKINFLPSGYKMALDSARKTNKLVFLDAYAEWCGPCKLLDRRTFKEEEVALFYNKNFVNLKMDMEKGEGPTLSNKYKVNAYPTLIFLDAEGNEVHRHVGYLDGATLIEVGKTALNKLSE